MDNGGADTIKLTPAFKLFWTQKLTKHGISRDLWDKKNTKELRLFAKERGIEATKEEWQAGFNRMGENGEETMELNDEFDDFTAKQKTESRSSSVSGASNWSARPVSEFPISLDDVKPAPLVAPKKKRASPQKKEPKTEVKVELFPEPKAVVPEPKAQKSDKESETTRNEKIEILRLKLEAFSKLFGNE